MFICICTECRIVSNKTLVVSNATKYLQVKGSLRSNRKFTGFLKLVKTVFIKIYSV